MEREERGGKCEGEADYREGTSRVKEDTGRVRKGREGQRCRYVQGVSRTEEVLKGGKECWDKGKII